MEQHRDDMTHDFLQAKDAIFAWKAHILRSENQEKAKQVALKDLNEKSVLIVMDWAMKIVQLRYREKKSDISSVISKKSDGQYEITSYAHLFDSCKQDWYTVACILEDLLGTISKENPEITQAFLRSDEAGCYHNNLLLAAIRDVSKRSKIKVSTYQFSEPQYGKDVCDRILCPLKSSIRRYCNEGNDILSAKNMREALQKRPVKGTIVSVNLVNREKMQLVVNKQRISVRFTIFNTKAKACGFGRPILLAKESLFRIGRFLKLTRNQNPWPLQITRPFSLLVLLEAIKRNQQMKQKTMNCTNVLNWVAKKHSNPWKSYRHIRSLVIMKKLSNLKAFTTKYEGSGLAISSPLPLKTKILWVPRNVS
jgi:hypothetical protein